MKKYKTVNDESGFPKGTIVTLHTREEDGISLYVLPDYSLYYLSDENDVVPLFQVGDRVRIREWEDMEREFGLDCDEDIACSVPFTRAMRGLCGKEFTIEEVNEHRVEGLDTDYIISTDTIEPVEEGENKITKINYKNLYLEEVIKGLDYTLLRTKTYKGKLINEAYAHELVDFILKMESLGYCEANLVPYFEKDERDEE